MASPAYQGTDRYGPTAYTFPGGGWSTSITLSAPSFSCDMCLVVIAADFLHASTPAAQLDHWDVPASWINIGVGGATVDTGVGNTVNLRIRVFQCAPSAVAATIRPEKADNTLFTPSESADSRYWRVFVTGWTPGRFIGHTANGPAGETRATVPYSPASPFIDGSDEGTWVQFTAGTFRYGTSPGTVNTANGFTQRFTETNFVVASKAFASTGTTDPCIYDKYAGSLAIAGSFVVALDLPFPSASGWYRGRRMAS